MAIVRPMSKKLLTKHEFMRRVQQSIIRVRNVQKHEESLIESLMEQVVKSQSPRQAGDDIELNVDPYTVFNITKVFPDIDWKEQKIRWKYFGQFVTWEEKEEGSIYEDEIATWKNEKPEEVIDISES